MERYFYLQQRQAVLQKICSVEKLSSGDNCAEKAEYQQNYSLQRDLKKRIFKEKTPATFLKTAVMFLAFKLLQKNVIIPEEMTSAVLYESSLINVTPAILFFTVYLFGDYLVYKLQPLMIKG